MDGADDWKTITSYYPISEVDIVLWAMRLNILCTLSEVRQNSDRTCRLKDVRARLESKALWSVIAYGWPLTNGTFRIGKIGEW